MPFRGCPGPVHRDILKVAFAELPEATMSDEKPPPQIPPGLGLPEPDHPVWQMANIFPDSPLGEQAWAAFERDLPGLLETSRGQWAAYHGAQRLAVGPQHTRLYEECIRRGLSPDEFVICEIEPNEGYEVLGMGGCRWEEEGE
jgi:hypothetical protein